MEATQQLTAEAEKCIQSILTAVKHIQRHPEVLEDGPETPLPVLMLQEAEVTLWTIIGASEA